MISTQYDQDLAPVPDSTMLVILRHGDPLVYAVQDWSTWSIHRLHIDCGTAVTGCATYASFIEAARAYRVGAVIWTAPGVVIWEK